MSTRQRRGVRAVSALSLAAVAAALLSACVALPTSGPVQQGLTEVPEPPGLGFLGNPPEPGDSPSEILSGFVQAATSGLSADSEFSLARMFLTPEASSTWRPLEEVLVYATESTPEIDVQAQGGDGPGATQPPIEDADRASAVISVHAVAAVDAHGTYTVSATPELPTDLDFTLVRVDGEWRIEVLPDGMLVSEPTFGPSFRQMPLYFWSPDFEALVPDVRYFPSQNAAGYAVTELLAGPSSWLSSAVATRIPDGVTLDVASSVVVADGVASVNLSAEAQAADFEDRKYLYTQIQQTLLAIPSIRSVELTMGGAAYQVPSGMPEPIVEPRVGSVATVLTNGTLARLQGSTVTPVDGVGDLSDLLPANPAVGYGDEGTVLLAGADAVVHVSGEGAVTTLITGRALAPPSFDRQGWVWTAPRDTDGTLLVAQVGGEPEVVSAPWLEGAQVLGLRVSREGARIAVLLRRDGVDEVVVAAVVRDAVGMPRTVPEGIPVASRLLAARGVVWVDSTTVAVLAQPGAESDPAVRLATVPGPHETTQAVPAAVSLAAGNGSQELLVGTSDDHVLARSGLRWELAAEDVRDPAYPG
ncbi:lipoprotein LpqB [Beutenbergia cavernae DSM 12333]|uniref:Lipoprotein LpqB n=1 Tax=Beutenbergia cavernae (strain ATCC BAA-8 / DSM 12333 / CCUG 43141 / JCM 11478 / NBRC 16432 / NCIMB 13614 / HKI 0122) TaxID=471853 RepID=C5C1N4_BEUC1|nr:LpqB family beta-propeller domain-containing protein [Beutenbergia cavernae]ACQ79502.1 lipoprotein LpqB [Beutenbergia cavernae DSM 12333]